MTQIAYVAAGCFWCVEALLNQVEGVVAVKPGYMGGQTENPTYKEVCEGNTGHAEVCEIAYDTEVLNFKQLLVYFFWAHDPTQLNRQGNDVGTQYRSAIFYRNEEEKEIARQVIEGLNAEKIFENPIVTTLEAAAHFYPAENYHENYYANNPQQPYCYYVIKPKLEKFTKWLNTQKQ